jgi:hypothetical protein
VRAAYPAPFILDLTIRIFVEDTGYEGLHLLSFILRFG